MRNLTGLLALRAIDFLVCVSVIASAGCTRAQTTAAAKPTNAADFYRGVNQLFTVDCPSTSSLSFPEYPPYGPAWDDMEKTSWAVDQRGLTRLREGRSIQQPNWPDYKSDSAAHPVDGSYLNQLRNVANHVGDDALYLHFQGNDAAAIDTLQDLFVMTDLLDQKPWDSQIRVLVGDGIRALCASKLMVITSDIKLTGDVADHQRLQLASARRIIQQLLIQNDPVLQWGETTHSVKSNDEAVAVSGNKDLSSKAIETLNRVNAEQSMTAMSMACHLYFLDQRRWPKSIDELVPAYLPHTSTDPWGDGRQTLGYVLVKNGLPDGSDRPLVYSRRGLRAGLFYRSDQPEYGFYNSTPGSASGGQFRDVASWVPIAAGVVGPTTRSLQ